MEPFARIVRTSARLGPVNWPSPEWRSNSSQAHEVHGLASPRAVYALRAGECDVFRRLRIQTQRPGLNVVHGGEPGGRTAGTGQLTPLRPANRRTARALNGPRYHRGIESCRPKCKDRTARFEPCQLSASSLVAAPMGDRFAPSCSGQEWRVGGRGAFVCERHSVPSGRRAAQPNQPSAEIRSTVHSLGWCGSESICPLTTVVSGC